LTAGAGSTTVECTFSSPIPAGGYAPFLDIAVTSPTLSMLGSLLNEVTVSGGGAPVPVSQSTETQISSEAPEFDVSSFSFDPAAATGAHDGDELTSVYLNAYPAEGMHPRFAQVVILVSFFDADHRICGRVGLSCAEFIHSRSRFHWRFSHRR